MRQVAIDRNFRYPFTNLNNWKIILNCKNIRKITYNSNTQNLVQTVSISVPLPPFLFSRLLKMRNAFQLLIKLFIILYTWNKQFLILFYISFCGVRDQIQKLVCARQLFYLKLNSTFSSDLKYLLPCVNCTIMDSGGMVKGC